MKILIAIPAYNEDLILEKNIIKIFEFCQKNLSIGWQVVIADNNSTDKTAQIAKDLATKFSGVEYLFVAQKGKGIAIKTAWQKYQADIYCFMDADLATDLSALPELISGISHGYDVVIGSRFHRQSKVARSSTRKIISNGYRLILKVILGLKINDAPWGFKAIKAKIKEDILPQVKNNEWFFDSELVVLAEKKGYKIKEIPVVWHDPRVGEDRSKVNPISLSFEYFKQVLALKKQLKK